MPGLAATRVVLATDDDLFEAAVPDFGAAITDAASAIEALGHSPWLVAGSVENFKVTWPEDFALAERLLQSRA